jgi:hypothetical protein
MQSPRQYSVLSSKLLQPHFAGAVAGNECGDHFRSLTRGLVTIFFHPPILPAHTHLHRLHPLYPLQKFGVPAVGKKVFIRLQQMKDYLGSVVYVTSAIVPAEEAWDSETEGK